MSVYKFQEIEKKWRQYWKENKSFAAEKNSQKPKYYVLDMFPYPSGKGLHVGHPLGYIATDIMARYKRIKGYNVMHPMGFDAFGLPAEQYAIQTGIHPAITTEKNIARYLEQMSNLGLYHNPEALLSTAEPNYYKWTQWIFLELYKHWYNKAIEKAEPIESLVAEFGRNGNKAVLAATSQRDAFTAAQWKRMSAKKQHEILMNYRLAYLDKVSVNWCPALGTVLANEEVKDGKSERGGHPVERKLMQQWLLRITAYADRLLYGLDTIDWSDALKTMQRNWIGRSEGARLRYKIAGFDKEELVVFTTRPDTIYGNTFMVVAPEHPLVEKITTPEQQNAVNEYVSWAKNRQEKDRIADTSKTGVWTGAYALHPLTQSLLPIWISDYVVITYGTGAIMSVPAHDERDYEFAKKFGLEIQEVIAGGDISVAPHTAKAGTMVNSGSFTGMLVAEAIPAIINKLEHAGIGKREVTYRQRDVTWSRQRYWGEPTPILHKNGLTFPVDEAELPLVLPEVEAFTPSATGEPPLSRAKDWAVLPDGSQRDLNTMPGWAGSSWYFLRYPDAHNETAFADKAVLDYWMPVDLYVGGTEHAVGHLMYSRFWTKFLKDLGYVSVEEPFQKLINQGMIQGVSQMVYRDKKTNELVSADLIETGREDDYVQLYVDVNLVKNQTISQEALREFMNDAGLSVRPNAAGEVRTGSLVEKMSKSHYNTVDPDDVREEYGTDTFRLFEMFLGPIELSKPWNTDSIIGVFNFMKRAYNLFVDEVDNFVLTEEEPSREELKYLHQLIKKTEEGIERFAFNTCVPEFMVFVKEMGRINCRKRAILEPFVICISPFAPHLAEELWAGLGHTESVLTASFPQWKEEHLVEDVIEYPVQINGKLRFKLSVPADMVQDEVGRLAITHEQALPWLDGKPPKKVIVVPGRIVNVVV